MAFIDEIKFFLSAGRGGDGVVRWRREKGKPLMGPGGGDGGRGGDVYALDIRDIQALSRYVHRKEFFAGNGGAGGNNNLHGKDGKDLILELPIGSVITNLKTKEKISLEKEGEKVLLLKGGGGGLGNEHFKSSTNRSPKEFTPGKDGDSAQFSIELELFADIGLIGMPNAGKSSLLNTLTHSRAKVGDYAFTTLDPNLGEMYGFIVADLPGLIEGAAQGKGLGHKFLRHVKRTKMLAHLVSLENEDITRVYKTIRQELSKYDKSLAKKKEILVLTKSDTIPADKLSKIVKSAQKLNKNVFAITLYDDDSVKKLRDVIVEKLRKLLTRP